MQPSGDGLNQYDGYDVKIFKNTVEQELLVSNRVRTISEDQEGNLWIGTDEGISLYDFTQQQFRHLYANRLVNKGINGPIVRKIILYPGSDQVLCATEREGVLVFDRQGSHRALSSAGVRGIPDFARCWGDSSVFADHYDGHWERRVSLPVRYQNIG